MLQSVNTGLLLVLRYTPPPFPPPTVYALFGSFGSARILNPTVAQLLIVTFVNLHLGIKVTDEGPACQPDSLSAGGRGVFLPLVRVTRNAGRRHPFSRFMRVRDSFAA